MVTITISFQCKNDKEAESALGKIETALKGAVAQHKPESEVSLEADDETFDVAPKPKRGRPKKEEVETPEEAPKARRGRPKKEEVEPDIEDEIEEVDDEEVEDEFLEEEEDDDDEVITPDEQKKLKAALRAYSDKHSRDAAAKILLKYGKTSAHVKKKDLAKLLKALKV